MPKYGDKNYLIYLGCYSTTFYTYDLWVDLWKGVFHGITVYGILGNHCMLHPQNCTSETGQEIEQRWWNYILDNL